MYAVSRKIFDGSREYVYVNQDHPFKCKEILSETGLLLLSNLAYDSKTLKIIKNRDNIELTDDFLQQINDLLLIEEL